MKQRFYKVQLCEAHATDSTGWVDVPHWFFRLRWLNGRVAVTSESYTRKGTARRLARQFHAGFSAGVGSLAKFEDLT